MVKDLLHRIVTADFDHFVVALVDNREILRRVDRHFGKGIRIAVMARQGQTDAKSSISAYLKGTTSNAEKSRT